MKSRLLVIITIVIVLGSFVPAFGLSCDMRTVQHQYDSNDVVFEGKVFLKKYFPGSEAALVTFEIKNVFKGDPPNPLILFSNEGFYGFKFRAEKTYIVFAEKTEVSYTVPLCVPVYHSFPSIVQGLYSVNDGIGDFGSLATGNLYENLSDEEKNKLEKIYEEESELRKIENENIEKTRTIIISLIIVGIIGGIVGGIVFVIRRKRQ